MEKQASKQDTLKHEGYQVGDVIKAYDFEPRQPWIENGKLIEPEHRYLIGRVTAIGRKGYDGFKEGREGEGALVYQVEVMKDTVYKNKPREEAFVPMENLFSDWDKRVSKVNEITT